MGLQGYKSTRRKIEGIRRDLADNVNNAVARGADATAEEAKRQVAMWDAVWRRNLYESIGSTRMRWDTGVTRHAIRARTPYAAYVEFGTGARGRMTGHFGNVNPMFKFDSPDETDWNMVYSNILWWVNTKPMFLGSRGPGTAAAITETIIEQGTYAQPFMRPAWNSGKHKVVGWAKAAAKRTVRRT